MPDDADLVHELPSIAVAVDHLDWAIRLLIDHKALVPAYSLAGIAEETIGKRIAGPNALARLRETFPGYDFNALRNYLKHGTVSGKPAEIIDVPGLRQEVALMIHRACENLMLYDGSVASQGSRFAEWCHRTLPEVFGE